MRFGDVLEYEKRVSPDGTVAVRFIKNLSEAARAKRDTAVAAQTSVFKSTRRNGEVVSGTEMKFTEVVPLTGKTGERLRAAARRELLDHGYPPTWAEDGNVDGLPVRCFQVNWREVKKALDANYEHMAKGEPKETIPEDLYQYVVTWGVDDPGTAHQLVYFDGVWYAKWVLDGHPSLLKPTQSALAETQKARPGDIPSALLTPAGISSF